MNLPKKAAVGAATLVAVLGAGGTAWAVESSATTPPPAPPRAPAGAAVPAPPGHGARPGRRGRIEALLNRADHGTLEIHTKGGWETIDYDRGKVTASSATSITLLRPDGKAVTEAVTSATKHHGPGSVAVVGRPARVISLNGNALVIAQGGGAKPRAGRSGAAPSASAGGSASA